MTDTNRKMFSSCMDFFNGKIGTFGGTNVCISSTIVLVSIVSYGSQNWNNSTVNHISSEFHQTPLQNFQKLRPVHSRTYLCYTNDPGKFRSLRWRPKVFAANISAEDYAFLLLDFDLERTFKVKFDKDSDSVCVSKQSGAYLHHCCAYSPNGSENERQEWHSNSTYSYYRKEIKDNYFRIEDFVEGKPLFVHQLVKVGLTNSGVNISIAVQHRCRGDVPLDPYPEVHITTDQTTPDRGLIHKTFHWYL